MVWIDGYQPDLPRQRLYASQHVQGLFALTKSCTALHKFRFLDDGEEKLLLHDDGIYVSSYRPFSDSYFCPEVGGLAKIRPYTQAYMLLFGPE